MDSAQSDITRRQQAWQWLPVVLIILADALVRFRSLSTGNMLLFGSDGPYYPMQVRSLLENHRLAFPDMPLLFMVQAGIAQCLFWLHAGSFTECILMSIRFCNSVLPPLAAIPVFLIAKELNRPGKSISVPVYILLGFSVFNLGAIAVFNSSLQKNEFALVFAFAYLLFITRLIKQRQASSFYSGLCMLALCALTHFGTFSIMLMLTGFIASFWLSSNRKALTPTVKKGLWAFAALLPPLFAAIAFFDFERFMRLLRLPAKLFEAPVLLFLLSDIESGLQPLNLLNLIPIHLLCITAFIFLLRSARTGNFGPGSKMLPLAWAMLAATLLMASPVLGLEWSNRMFIMSYVPLTLLYLLLLNAYTRTSQRIFPVTVFAGSVALSVLHTVSMPDKASMAEVAFNEMEQIPAKAGLRLGPDDMIIGLQDVRMLGNWLYKTKSVADYMLRPADFSKYRNVYVLNRQKGSVLTGNRFRPIQVPAGSDTVFKGEYFTMFRLNGSQGWKFGKGKPSRTLRGRIVEINNESGFVLEYNNAASHRTVLHGPGTTVSLLNNAGSLKKGMLVEVPCTWRIFSLAVDADIIREVKSFE
ncbi:MAG: hypothetical protein V4543_01915 [Bacteroidota bacterium]